jgi:ribosome-associated translation inhibitor RaiA
MSSSYTATAQGQEAGEAPPLVRFPYDISFIDCEPSAAVRFQIEENLSRVDHLYHRIIDCKVAVRIAHKHSKNRFFHIHVQMDIPGRRLVVSRDTESPVKNTEIHRAVRDAFHKLARQLDDVTNIRQSFAVKSIPQPIIETEIEPEWD